MDKQQSLSEKSRNVIGEILAPFLLLALVVLFNPGHHKMENKDLIHLLKEWQEYGILINHRNKLQNQELLNELIDKTINALQNSESH